MYCMRQCDVRIGLELIQYLMHSLCRMHVCTLLYQISSKVQLERCSCILRLKVATQSRRYPVPHREPKQPSSHLSPRDLSSYKSPKRTTSRQALSSRSPRAMALPSLINHAPPNLPSQRRSPQTRTTTRRSRDTRNHHRTDFNG